MLTLSLKELAKILDTEMPLGAPDVRVDGVSTDSRTIRQGELFFALSGPSFDGHDFLPAVKLAGAGAAIVARLRPELLRTLPQLLVRDPREALAVLATAWRARFDIPVLAVTGSNGKTTVKEMTSSCLKVHVGTTDGVLATRGNLNNDIGLPSTLFELGYTHRFAVLEIGANRPGEIASLSTVAQPQIGIVTQCAPAHLEGFGSLEAVARAKGELFAAIPSTGTAIINADDRYAGLWRELASHTRQVTFGLSADADISCQFTPEAYGSRILAKTPNGPISIRLPLFGRHNVMNALGVIAQCLAAGLGLEAIRDGLECAAAIPGRLRLRAGLHGALLLDDSYNANPASLSAALQVLVSRPGRSWLVLGDMAELGCRAADYHREAGMAALAAGVERLFAFGEQSQKAARAFGNAAQHFSDINMLIAELRRVAEPGVVILVKGSRSMRMERVVDGLVEEGYPCC